jgi:hypothetical protein
MNGRISAPSIQYCLCAPTPNNNAVPRINKEIGCIHAVLRHQAKKSNAWRPPSIKPSMMQEKPGSAANDIATITTRNSMMPILKIESRSKIPKTIFAIDADGSIRGPIFGFNEAMGLGWVDDDGVEHHIANAIGSDLSQQKKTQPQVFHLSATATS